MKPIVLSSDAANPHSTARRRLLHTGVALAAIACLSRPGRAAPGKEQGTEVELWKDPNCGCCHDWMAHMQGQGFRFTVHDTGNTAVRNRLGLPHKLGSCHTALVGGYVVEGHVPAPDVRRLLKERPAALGLAVPGMPIGSPGMDGPAYGGRRDAYEVLLVARGGATSVYARYPASSA